MVSEVPGPTWHHCRPTLTSTTGQPNTGPLFRAEPTPRLIAERWWRRSDCRFWGRNGDGLWWHKHTETHTWGEHNMWPTNLLVVCRVFHWNRLELVVRVRRDREADCDTLTTVSCGQMEGELEYFIQRCQKKKCFGDSCIGSLLLTNDLYLGELTDKGAMSFVLRADPS